MKTPYSFVMSNLNTIRKSWELGMKCPKLGVMWLFLCVVTNLWLLPITSLININSFPNIWLALSFTIAQLTFFNCKISFTQLHSFHCSTAKLFLLSSRLEKLHHKYCFCKCRIILSPTLMPQHVHQFHFGASLTTSTLNQVWIPHSCRSMTSMHFFRKNTIICVVIHIEFNLGPINFSLFFTHLAQSKRLHTIHGFTGGHSEPAPTNALWRMNGKWSENNFLLGCSSLTNYGG
jgi:hypothetical protein